MVIKQTVKIINYNEFDCLSVGRTYNQETTTIRYSRIESFRIILGHELAFTIFDRSECLYDIQTPRAD